MPILFKSLFAIILLSIFISCKKTNNQIIQKTPITNLRVTGLIPTAPEEYKRLVNLNQLTKNTDSKSLACTSVDLTSQFPLPGDQGVQGSCVAWSVGYTAKSYWERKEIGWSIVTNNHLFSPQYIYSQTHASNISGGGGSSFSAALNLAVNQGVATLNICPYDPSDINGYLTQPTLAMRNMANNFRNSSWTALPYQDLKEIKTRLCNSEPVMMGIPVFPDFDNLNSFNDTYDNLAGTLRGYHAITIIGFDDAKGAFKFINQWGTIWGVNGYGWISYNLIANNNFENYVMQDTKNSIFSNDWSATSLSNLGTLGYYSGDVNGDGNTDIIQPWNNNGTLAIIVHNITGNSTNYICNNTMIGSSATSIGFVAADFNGDGKSDLVQGWKNGNSIAFSVFKSNGTSLSPFGTWTMSAGSSTIKLLPVDIDGDGKTDIAQLWDNNGKLGINILKSTGTSYVSSYSIKLGEGSTNIGFISADCDGDGKTDIIQFWNNSGALGVIIYKSTGSSYYAAWSGKMSEASTNVGFVPVDYEGNGKMNFIQGWNNGGFLNVLSYNSSGLSYGSINNSFTLQGYQNLALLPVKKAGVNKTGFVQVYNNNGKTAFNCFNVTTYK